VSFLPEWRGRREAKKIGREFVPQSVRTPLSAFVLAVVFAVCLHGALAASSSFPAQKSKGKVYTGPRARISVAEIKDQTAAGGLSTHWMERFRITWKEIGEGMREMLVTALFQTKHFVLLERDLLPEILKEQDFGASGRVKEGTAASTGGIIGTDLIVTGAVTEFIADAYGAKGAADAWGTQVDASVSKGYVGLDVRIVDAKTSEVVVATYVMGKASNYGFDAEAGPESKLPVSLSVFARTPAERAIRSAIQKAAADIVSMVPKEYFRY
jgi:curli biogenesis system outer membrane secretion channel CsgG